MSIHYLVVELDQLITAGISVYKHRSLFLVVLQYVEVDGTIDFSLLLYDIEPLSLYDILPVPITEEPQSH